MINYVKVFDKFSIFCGIRPNKIKMSSFWYRCTESGENGKFRKMRNLKIKGKALAFKALADLKIIRLALVNNIPITVINELKRYK